MRRIALTGLILLLAGCVAPAGDNLRRTAITEPLPSFPPPRSGGPSLSAPSALTLPAVGYGAAPPTIPAGGLGAEAPMPAPKGSRMPTIAAQPGVPPSSSAAGQPIMVPNGNGTTTIIHADGTVETIPTPK